MKRAVPYLFALIFAVVLDQVALSPTHIDEEGQRYDHPQYYSCNLGNNNTAHPIYVITQKA